MHLKLLQKKSFKEHQKQQVISLEIKLLIKVQESQNFSKNNSETNKEGILRERYIPTELNRKIIDDLRLKEERKLKQENERKKN